MNFLPEEDKGKIRGEYLRRLLVVFGFFFFSAVFFGIILLLSSSTFLREQKHSLEYQLAISEERLVQDEAGDIIPLVEDLNAKVSLLDSEQKDLLEKSTLVKIILEGKTEKIKINDFYFEKARVSIQGLSESRQDLLAFIDSLRQKKEFKKIESPISNLIKEKDIDFKLTIEL